MREATVEALLRREVRALGGWAVKLVPWAESGLPDRLVLLPGGRAFFVELKRPGIQGLRASQRRVRRKLAPLGFAVEVLNTKPKVEAFIERERRT